MLSYRAGVSCGSPTRPPFDLPRNLTSNGGLNPMKLHRPAVVLTLLLALGGASLVPAVAQDNATTTTQDNATQNNKETRKQLKKEEKAEKDQAKADKAERKALNTKEQKKADKAQDKADKASGQASSPPS